MRVEKERLDAYLKKIHGSVCPLCRNTHWEISDVVFQAIEFDKQGILLNGSSYPMIPLTCKNCGNTYFINALVAKLIDPQKNDLAANSVFKEKGSGETDE